MTNERPISHTHPSALDTACAPVQSPLYYYHQPTSSSALDHVRSNESQTKTMTFVVKWQLIFTEYFLLYTSYCVTGPGKHCQRTKQKE